ncbi:MAG TPA: hypothetical protein VD995_03315 [Azospirillum sp.]|nr:hypothetical protein [Azospirillum sp.]
MDDPRTPAAPAEGRPEVPADNARLPPVCTLYCGAAPVRVFSVDGTTYVLGNDLMRAAGASWARQSVDHAASTFPELREPGAVLLRQIDDGRGAATRLLSIPAAKVMVARSRSAHAVGVLRWLYTTFGPEGEAPPIPPGLDMGEAGAGIPTTNLVRMELTVTIEKARRILDIAGS